MTRAPVFRTEGIEHTRRFLNWVRCHEAEIRHVAEGTSTRVRLVEIRPQVLGTTVYLRLRFTCGDAMGMNLATVACDHVVREAIEPGTGASCVALSGSFCVDKKASAVNMLEGRGKRIHAEVTLDAHQLVTVLKTTAVALCEVQYRKNLLGSIMAGAMGGFNAHYANMVAACGSHRPEPSRYSTLKCQGRERASAGGHAGEFAGVVSLADLAEELVG
ncbi:3-hydroxy-3-methylglutaryl-coenzyme A reductase [Lentzea atacamensis]|uniref:3-hydroxy-3-methylglutaryl-coenzyme A reductase n=2 Tax=Lentzea atacamensis TaxID=531938 RepID=A0A316IH84_9PSEU|nr:3-hydroxy-3-methylglutaryl-coenzyme A reductase [Lentzea atacamensis]RAS60632.1 3-hydroxy-3-methylglutaryl-coenzyme A reductase [Lentzea atacamensis]